MPRDNDGWYFGDVPQAAAGTRYKFRIDDDVDVPDPASAFQPDDVFEPGEVIDHSAFAWRDRLARTAMARNYYPGGAYRHLHA